MKVFYALIIACGLASCAQVAKPSAVFGVAVAPDGEYILGTKAYSSVADCHKFAQKYVADAAKEGYKLGCAAIELE
jgi:hypothetical protein